MNAASPTPLMTQEQCDEYRKQTNARLANLRTWISMLVTAMSVAIAAVGAGMWIGWMSAVKADSVDRQLQVHKERGEERDTSIAATLKRLEDGQKEIFTLLRTK